MADINLPTVRYVLIIGSERVSVIQNSVTLILRNPNLYSSNKIAAHRKSQTSEVTHNFLRHLEPAETAQLVQVCFYRELLSSWNVTKFLFPVCKVHLRQLI